MTGDQEISSLNFEQRNMEITYSEDLQERRDEIEKKRNVVQELIYRMDLEEANKNSKNKKKVLKIKSA